jgi:hypothetical protein
MGDFTVLTHKLLVLVLRDGYLSGITRITSTAFAAVDQTYQTTGKDVLQSTHALNFAPKKHALALISIARLP